MGGFGVVGFENAAGSGSALDYIQDAFQDISVPANSNSGFSSTVLRNPLQHFYTNDDAPRYAAKILWIKDLTPVTDRTLWINGVATYNVVWNEDFPAAKGYIFGAASIVNAGGGVYVDCNRIGDGVGVGGVIRRVQWIVDSKTAATATAQLKLDGSNVSTIDFSLDAQNWSGQPKFNPYTSAASNETRDIHDYQLVAIQPGTLRVTGVVVYYEVSGTGIDCFGGSTYLNKTKVTTTGSTLALPSLANFRGGRASIYKTVTASYGVTTSAVSDISSIATGSSGTNLLNVQTGHGSSFLAGTYVWGGLSATHYIGNVLSVSGDVLTMGVTLPQGLSNSIFQLLQAGHTFSVNQTLSIKSFDFNPYLPMPVIGSTVPSGVLAFQDPNLRYRVWGGTLQIIPGTSMSSTLGVTYGIDLSHANSFLQVDGRFQSLEFEFMSGASGYIQATFGIDGIRAFNINEAFSGPGIFRKTVAIDSGPGWHSVVMNRGASHQAITVSRIVGYENKVVSGPSFGQLAQLDIGQTFLLRDSVNATLTAFGKVQRIYADSLYAKGPWTRGTTNVVAGGAYWHGSTTTSTIRMQYYGTGVAFIGAIGNSNSITIDGLAQTASFGTWVGLSLALDFHSLAFSCNAATTRIDAIDVLMPSSEIRSVQNYKPLSTANLPLVDNVTMEYDWAQRLRVKEAAIGATYITPNSVGTTALVNGSVTYAKRAALNIQVSSSTGSYSTNSAAYADVTNATVTITSSGRQIYIGLQSDGTVVTGMNLSLGRSSSGSGIGFLKLVRDVTDIAAQAFAGDGGAAYSVPTGGFYFVDQPGAGTFVYKLQAKVNTGGTDTFTLNAAKLVAYEL